MSEITQQSLDAAVKDETERCARLVEMRAAIARESAARTRKIGSYTAHNIWPLLSKSIVVAPRYEQAAREMEEVAHTLDVVADCIRKGYDPRSLETPKCTQS